MSTLLVETLIGGPAERSQTGGARGLAIDFVDYILTDLELVEEERREPGP